MPVPDASNSQPRLLDLQPAAPASIISASRRTDIPAWYSQWFLNRLQAGGCHVLNPYSRKWFTVSLRPEDVGGIVFWTRNMQPLMPQLENISRKFTWYVQFTITGYGAPLDPNGIPVEQAVAQVIELAKCFGPQCVTWRFDPLVLMPDLDVTETLERFTRLADILAGHVNNCSTSYMNPYRRQQQAFKKAGLVHDELEMGEKIQLGNQLWELARERNIDLQWCCDSRMTGARFPQARCLDADRLRQLGATRLPAKIKPAPSREGCACMQAKDIGAYDMCIAGCLYCYATRNHELAGENHLRHSPDHLALAQASPGVTPPEIG